MALPENIRRLVDREISRTWSKDKEGFRHLDRRKGVTPKHEKGVTSRYKPLIESQWDKYLLPWNNFHKELTYNSFQEFYNKGSFCSTLERDKLPKDIEKARELFLYLLADRYFLFLEYNENLNAPYPPMCEIVRVPKLYLESKDAPIKEETEMVLKHGFIPTGTHAAAYRQMCENFESLNRAICLRKRCIKKDQELHQPLKRLYEDIQIRIEAREEKPSELEKHLCALFRTYLAITAKYAYAKEYQDFLKLPQNNYLPAIHAVIEYLKDRELQPYSALVLFHLFTQCTKKLACGKLKDFKFKALPHRATEGRPQEITRQRTECKIMLFDLLLDFLQPDDPDYLKYLFCQYTRFNGYNHFTISGDQNTMDFSYLPNPRDCVDQLGGEFRRHIRFCISNDVSWLTPGLPNNREFNSIALATLLLHDAKYLPVYTRLTDRVRRLLDSSKIANMMIGEYQDACHDQGKTLDLLENWCRQYGLEFIGEESFMDLWTEYPEMLRQICSRFVLEFMLKERVYDEARKNLSQVAQALFGELCLEGEMFWIT